LRSPIEVLIRKKLGDEGEKLLLKGDYRSLMKALKEVLAKEVNSFLQEHEMISPPFDPFKVKQVGTASIRVEFVSNMAVEGLVDTDKEGFLIKLSDKVIKSKVRLRSTLAHELMHILFFYDASKLPPARLGCAVGSHRFAAMEEELCYFLTREFLMPRISLIELMHQDESIKQASMRNIVRLKGIYVVSSDIVAWRLIKDLQTWKAAFAKIQATDGVFKLVCRLKSGTKGVFKHLKLPRYLEPSSNGWLGTILSMVDEAISQPQAAKRINMKEVLVDGTKLKVESLVESKKPLTLSILASLDVKHYVE
jgi:hypothetical protein